MAKEKNKKTKTSKNEENKELFAFLAVFLTLIGFLIALILKKDNKYIMYYAKQSIVLFMGFAISSLITKIPYIGWLGIICIVFLTILWVITWINALSGMQKETFIITNIAEKINL
ncbi:MAG: hypothetical protein ACP5OG_05330 [Candidatus Nanoarchaeia archaeon]